MSSRRAHPARLLDPYNLEEVAHWANKLTFWRDQYAPGKPIWLAETGNAQYGGEPGLSDVYISGLWWLDQSGLLARMGHEVVVRQTLTGMNYGLLDEESLEPRPDYWNSLLWRRLMGTQVYDTAVEGDSAHRIRVYAHSAPQGSQRAITVLAINLDPERTATLAWPEFAGHPFNLYRLAAPDILGQAVLLNGAELRLSDDGALPELVGDRHEEEDVPEVTLLPLTYAFVQFECG